MPDSTYPDGEYVGVFSGGSSFACAADYSVADGVTTLRKIWVNCKACGKRLEIDAGRGPVWCRCGRSPGYSA